MQIRIGETTVLASDGRCTGQSSFEGFALSLTVGNIAEAQRLFAAISDGGQVQMPLTKTFFSPQFGMAFQSRFGVVDDLRRAVILPICVHPFRIKGKGHKTSPDWTAKIRSKKRRTIRRR